MKCIGKCPALAAGRKGSSLAALALLSPLTKRKYTRNQWACLGSWLAAQCQDSLDLGLSEGVRHLCTLSKGVGQTTFRGPFQPKSFLVQKQRHLILVSSFTYHARKNVLFIHVRKVSATGPRMMWPSASPTGKINKNIYSCSKTLATLQ